MNNPLNTVINNMYNNTLNKLENLSKKDPEKKILNAAKQVEGLFINMMLKSMRNSVVKTELLKNNAESMYTDMYDQQISKKISEIGLGLSKIIATQILQKQKPEKIKI